MQHSALQILQTNTRAPQNLQTAADVHSLVAVETDEHEIARIKMQCAAIKQNRNEIFAPTSETCQAHGKGCGAGG